jgi:transcriptional regulator with XRE-family HTH domain
MINHQQIRREGVGAYLRKIREARGQTQWELAQRLGYTTAQFVSNWERGVAYPAPESLELLAEALGIDFVDLVKRIYKVKGREVLAQRDAILNSKRMVG